ncbi:MAG: hypothetical protein IJW06_04110 [Clostridia bacterium]|nr:hypothetical protein [Clostridia bacterium]
MTKVTRKIEKAENAYKKEIEKIARDIMENRDVRLILVAGPSCSGKTTTSATISRYVREYAGIKSHTISIDDFYKDVEFLPGETVADKDFEALDSIDLDLLHSSLHDLSLGKTVDIPLFDFEKTYRNGIRSTITLGKDEIAIIEGLHALNPEIYENFVEKSKIRRVFLDCHDEHENNKFERLIRRLVRDRNFRNADAHLTFTLWSKVVAGEEKYIYPFSSQADFSVNTYHSYETEVLKPFAEKLLNEIGKDSIFYEGAKAVQKYLDLHEGEIPTELVPKDSLLREFIG